MSTPRILVFSGSTRNASLNRKLATVAAGLLGGTAASVTLLELRDYVMPLYNGDLEESAGIPEGARRLKAVFMAHDALLIASPENNASIPSNLKNTLDWLSRPDGAADRVNVFQGKSAALLAASPGALGGLRGLVHLRASLEALGVLVIPEQFALGQAHKAFADDGALLDAAMRARLQGVLTRLVQVAGALAP